MGYIFFVPGEGIYFDDPGSFGLLFEDVDIPKHLI
jgi:hypothetical protein